MDSRFLYCGMAADVITPFKLVPSLDVLFAICTIDKAYYRDGTVEGMMGDLVRCLTDGHNCNTLTAKIFKENHVPFELSEPCKNVAVKCFEERWEVSLSYLGKDRKIIYYPDRNFYFPWPEEVNEINHLTSLGAEFEYLKPTLKQMLHERCVSDCVYYEQWDYCPRSELIRPMFSVNPYHGLIRTYHLFSLLKRTRYNNL